MRLGPADLLSLCAPALRGVCLELTVLLVLHPVDLPYLLFFYAWRYMDFEKPLDNVGVDIVDELLEEVE